MKSFKLAAVMVGAIALSSCGDDSGKQPEAASSRHVNVVVAVEKPLDRGGEITGEISARIQTDLSFRVSGKIVDRLVDVGDVVKAGQVLARIDPKEQKAELEIATANLRSAQAQQTQAQLAFARQQSLFRTQVTTRAAVDQAQEAFLTAEGSLQSAQAQYENAQDAVSYTELKSDADGVITARNAEVGQVAQAAQVIYTLAHNGDKDAVFNVVESLFVNKAIEPTVTVALISDPQQKVDAEVREVSPTIDTSTGTIRVKVALKSGGQLPLGAPVVGRYRYKTESGLQLPWSALSSEAGQPAVWVVDSTSRAIPRAVKIEEYTTGAFVVASGLRAGETVITDGTKFLHPGEKVDYDGETSK